MEVVFVILFKYSCVSYNYILKSVVKKNTIAINVVIYILFCNPLIYNMQSINRLQ